MKSSISVVLVDDHAVVRAGLRSMLAAEKDIKVIGEGSNGTEAYALCRRLRPDVLLLDMRLPGESGSEICRSLKAGPSSPAVLILTSFDDAATVLTALEAGADGYLLKDVHGQDLAGAIRRAADGSAVLAPSVTRTVMESRRASTSAPNSPAAQLARLSFQERRALELVAAGQTSKEIASELNLSDGTVRNYLSATFAKLGVRSRAEAVVLWVKATMSGGG